MELIIGQITSIQKSEMVFKRVWLSIATLIRSREQNDYQLEYLNEDSVNCCAEDGGMISCGGESSYSITLQSIPKKDTNLRYA